MKTVKEKLGLFVRLSIAAATLLVGQQAMAVGTDPGTAVDNQATVNYDVNSIAQSAINSNNVQFLVDRRVNFTVSQTGVGLTQVTPGETGVWIEFSVFNLSNGDLDFNLASFQLSSGDGDVKGAGTTDTDVDMNNVTISVSAAPDGQPGGGAQGDGPDPVLGGPTVIDNLPEDDSIRVRIFADTPAAFGNGDIANIRLDVTAADPATGVDLVETPGADDPALVENVFADAGNDGVESEADGFLTVSADLVVTKSYAVISDPFGSGKAVPGAVIEYTITLDNSGGAADATDVSISDVVDADVTFVDPPAGYDQGNGENISFDGGASYCVADAADANGDGCSFDGTTLTLDGRDQAVLTPIDVAAGATVTVQFQVTVPTT